MGDFRGGDPGVKEGRQEKGRLRKEGDERGDRGSGKRREQAREEKQPDESWIERVTCRKKRGS